MSVTKFYKDAIHEIVDALPASAAAGYRCILSTNNVIYEMQGDGTWAQDADHGIGSRASLIGTLGDGTGDVKYLNTETLSEVLNTYFGTGNTMVIDSAIFWNDRLVIARTPGSLTSDIIIVYPNGDTANVPFTGVINNMAVDSLNNLWLSIGELIYKIAYTSPTSIAATMDYSLGSLPSEDIVRIEAHGLDLWAITDGTTFGLFHYNGYIWEDLTAQFKSDLSITTGNINGCTIDDMFIDSDGLLLLALHKGGQSYKLVSYDGTTFELVTVPAGSDYLKKVVKYGDTIYSIDDADDVIVFSYDDGSTITTDSTHDFTGLELDGDNVIAYEAGAILKTRVGVDELEADTALYFELSALLGTSPNLLQIKASAGRRIYLNTGSDKIIQGKFSEHWVEV